MLDREKVLTLLELSTQNGASELTELCRVYLAWLDASEVTVHPDTVTGDDDGAIWLEPEMVGKRVRLVEVNI